MSSKLAIEGGSPVRAKTWPAWPVWDEREERAILDVLRSGQWWSVGGQRVSAFEVAFAEFQGAKHAVCVTNGTAALEVVLRALGIGYGDEVIVPPYTFVATATSVLAVGAVPIFVDIEPGSLNLDPDRIHERVTPRTKAVIAVHFAGRPADMDGILAAAGRHGLAVIEDAAQAHAAEWRGRRVGAIGTAGTFSFQASKNLNAGEGGAVVTDDDALADRVWSVHNCGRTKGGGWYEHEVLGSNFRMTEWQAAILAAQLERAPEQTERRTACARRLASQLAAIPGIAVPMEDVRVTRHAYHLFVFRYESAGYGGRPREEFLRALNAEGVPCSSGYVPLYREPLFAAGRVAAATGGAAAHLEYASFAQSCPVCEQAGQDAVWLPQNLLLGEPEEMDDIARAIQKIAAAWG